jgi:stage II sporulation protein D
MTARAIAVFSTLVLLLLSVAFGVQAQAPLAKPTAEAQGRPFATPAVEPQSSPLGVAYLALNLATNKSIETIHADQLDAPTEPGSIMKIATLAAALESGVITPQTGILCTREVTIGGHRLICTHPDLHRPLTPAEALAYSCNVFFATVSARLSRSAFDDASVRLGLPRSNPGLPLGLAALGLEGVQATPRRLLEMMTRVAADPTALPWRPATLSIVREGLRGAAQFGTASALAAHGVDAMAKTGTVVTAMGPRGLVVGVTPASKPATGFVLLASGGAGMDAAALAADRLAERSSADGATLRVGLTRADGGYAVRSMPLEEYVAGVVAGEAAPNSTHAALEALAITTRTYAIANRGRHAADGFDLCDLTHCQVLRKPTTATTSAAKATAGRILFYKGMPASVYYSASCGGHTERPSQVWPGADDPPFLPSRVDDAGGHEAPWTADLAAADLARALRAAGFTGSVLRDLTIVARNDSGRVVRLRLGGFAPSEISGPDFRTIVGRAIGWQYIKSTAFDLNRTGAGFHFVGHGSGHGVGLCVQESARLAALGQPVEAILARYFPGTTISTLKAPSPPPAAAVTLSLPEGDQDERPILQDLAVRARDALAKQLGVPAPASLSLRFHPTVESYQRTTGKPWFTTAASTGTAIDLIPLAVLRQRGILERTVRHELVHVLTNQALADRPLWVREGAAMYFAAAQQEREVVIQTDPRSENSNIESMSCPTDRDLLKPVSAEALGRAYDRAAACFASQLRAGKAWRDIAR